MELPSLFYGPYFSAQLPLALTGTKGLNLAEDGQMHITLQKRDKGQTWSSPIIGQGQLDPYSTDLEQKRLMLQRFQEEVSLLAFPQI